MDRRIAAVYLRVSTEDQTEYSPDAQLRELRAYAEAHGITIDENYVFSDEGISGRDASKRPGFLAMIRAAKRRDHPFDLILVHKYDRFARSREDSVVYKSMLRRCGVEVISIKEPLSEGNYAGVMEAIYESFAEAYSVNLAQEVKKGMTEKALRGQLQTCPPFGYTVMEHKLVPLSEEADWVRFLFVHYAEGKTPRQLANDLNCAGIRTHRGNRFESRAVEYILKNPVYIGMLRWDPAKRAGRTEGSIQRIIVPGEHPPLIDQSLWEQVQKLICRRGSCKTPYKKPSSARKHWLSGIVRCGSCGSTLVWTKPAFFRCSKYLRGSCNTSQHCAAPVLEQALRSAMHQHLSVVPLPRYRMRNAENALTLARLQMNSIRKKQGRLETGYLDGILEADRARVLHNELRQQAKALENLIRDLSQQTQEQNDRDIENRMLESSKNLFPADLPIQRKYEAMNAVTKSLLFYKSEGILRLVYRFAPKDSLVTDQSKGSYSKYSFDPDVPEGSGSLRQSAGNGPPRADEGT